MHALLLSLTLLSPQGGGDPFPASRFLPADATLMAIELAPPERLLRHQEQIAQLSVFFEPRVGDFMDWLGENDPWYAALHAHRPQMHALLGSFDRGISAASIFTPGRYNRPELLFYVVGGASEASRTRETYALLDAILQNPEESARKLETRQLPILDSPVQLRVYRRDDPAVENQDWGRKQALYAANRGQRAAFHLQYYRGSIEAERLKAYEQGIASRVGSLIGLGERTTGGNRLGDHRPQIEGEPLAHFVLGFHRCASHPEYGPAESGQTEMKQMGFWGFEGIDSTLSVVDGVARERIEIHHAGVEANSVFELFAEGELGLGDDAVQIPGNVVAALRVGLDGQRLTAWLSTFVEKEVRSDPKFVLIQARALLGLPANEGQDPDLVGLPAVTLCLVPAATGSPTPELAMLVRLPPREDQLDAVVKAWGGLFSLAMRAELPELKTLGKGAEQVRYLALKEMFPKRGGMGMAATEGLMVTNLLGGGFLSATRVGPFLAVGFNPRTLRKMSRDVAAGNVLAGRRSFLERFPAGSGRALEAWFDFPAVVDGLAPVEMLLPMITVSMLDGVGRAKVPPFPKARELVKHVREEYLWSERSEFGRVVHTRGGTMLSPSAWAASISGGMLADTLCRMLR